MRIGKYPQLSSDITFTLVPRGSVNIGISWFLFTHKLVFWADTVLTEMQHSIPMSRVASSLRSIEHG